MGDVDGTGGGPKRTLRADGIGRPKKQTKQAEAGGPSTTGVLLAEVRAGDVLCGDYTVVRVVRQHARDRAGLFRCAGPGGDEVLLKVAPPLHPPARDLWTGLPGLQHPNIMRTFTVIQHDGLFCDVQEYCQGGSLHDRPVKPSEACSPERVAWITDAVAPQLLAGLHYLHAQGRVHRDVKPENVYVRRSGGSETYVLADLDVSVEFEQDGRTRLTDQPALTDEFAAPEAFPDPDDSLVRLWATVTPKSDFYSLGVTLLWLLLGRTPLTGMGTRAAGWYREGHRLELPEGLPPRLESLLGGLLIRDHHRRWGDDATKRWIDDALSPDDFEAIESDRSFQFPHVAVRPHKLGDIEAHSLTELARAMQQCPDMAAHDLLEVDFIVNWLSAIDSNLARAAVEDREMYRDDKGLAVFAVGMLCDPDLPLTLTDGTQVANLPEVVGRLGLAAKGGDPMVVSGDNLARLEVWLRRRNPPDPVLADEVSGLTRVDLGDRVKAAQAAWLLDQSRPIQLAPGVVANTPREFATAAYGAAALWTTGLPEAYRGALDLLADGYVEAWLTARRLQDLAERVRETRKRLEDQDCAALETVLRLLDSDMPPVLVRFDGEEMRRTVSAQYGDVKRRRLPFTAVGPGVPYASVRLEHAHPGFQIEPPAEISGRRGELVMRLDSRNRVPAARRHTATLVLDSGYTRTEGGDLALHYRVGYPLRRTFLFIGIGALAGAVLIGAPRFLMHLLQVSGVIGVDPSWGTSSSPTSVSDYIRWIENNGHASLWQRIQWGDYPFWGVVLGLLALAVALLLAWRLWRWVLKTKAETGGMGGERG